MCQAVCLATLRNPSRVKTQHLVIEPSDDDPQGLLVARILCQTGKFVPVRLTNISEKELMIPAKIVVAKAFETDIEKSSKNGGQSVRKISTSDANEILKQLNLSDIETSDGLRLRNLVKEFIDIFKAPEQKLTCTSDVTHRIITEEVPPICKRPYRVPFQRQEVMKKEIQTLLNHRRKPISMEFSGYFGGKEKAPR